MSKRSHTEAEMIAALRECEAGRTYAEVGREYGVSKHTIYVWKRSTGAWR